MLNFVQHLLLRSSFILESVIGSLYGRGPRGPALSSQPTSWPHTAHDWPTKWLVNQESWSCPLHYHAKLGLLTQKPFVRTTQGILKSWWGPHKALPVLNKHLVTKQLSFHTHLGPIAQDILLAKACGAFKYVCIRALFSCCQLPIPVIVLLSIVSERSSTAIAFLIVLKELTHINSCPSQRSLIVMACVRSRLKTCQLLVD